MFTGTKGLYYNWSTVCEEAFSVFSYTPTTSLISSGVAIDLPLCNQIQSDCNSLTLAMTSCRSAYTSGFELDNCLCNDDMLYYGSRCDVDGNERCLLTTLDPASVYSNQICGNFDVAASTSRASSNLPNTRTIVEPNPTSTYTPPIPSPTASPPVSPTSSAPAWEMDLTKFIMACIVVGSSLLM